MHKIPVDAHSKKVIKVIEKKLARMAERRKMKAEKDKINSGLDASICMFDGPDKALNEVGQNLTKYIPLIDQ